MSKEKRRVPKLRFPGFTEDWEQRKLLTVLNKIVDYRGRTPKKLGLDWSPTGHLALSALNVKMGYVDKTVDAHYGDDHLYSVWMKDNDLYKGQVLFTTEAPMGNVAQVPDDNKYILSQRTIAFVPDRRVISDNFLAVVLSASKCQKSLINRASGGTAKGVSQKTLSEISLDIPQSLSEQDKVSELIKKLSKIITLHQRKLDNLKLKKKALLQKLFPKNGERYPELRFPGFTDAWEQRKLESILIEYIEKNPGNENLPVLTSSRQGLTKQEDHFGSVQRHDISDYNVIPLGFCTYRNRSDDKTFTFNINRIVPRGLVSKFYPVFEIKNGNADFITEYLNNNTEIIKSLATNAVGTSQVVLSLRTLRNIEITLPLKEEQVAIGDLMRKLDIYITLHQRKLDHLQLQKKALLQQMFV